MTFETIYTDGDIDTNPTANPHLNDLIEVRYSRRQTLMGGMSATAAAVFGGMLLTGCDDDNDGNGSSPVTVTATAGGSSTAGRVATLTGAAIGQVDSVTWTQTAGPAVTLAGATTATATFVVPGAVAGTVLSFLFTAVSASGSVTATTSVTVGAASLGFTAVAKSLADVVAVPSGYAVTVLYRLGDPIGNGVGAYANDGTDATFSKRAGDHHDGMSYFGLSATGTPDANGNTRGLLVLNHENITQAYLHPNGPTNTGGVRPEAEVLKEMECHGVSVIEINRAAAWSYTTASSFNRRITPLTPMSFSGPVRGADSLKTRYSPDATTGRGTINNCANGTMPWNTYLTNEENWVGYFRREVGDGARRAASGPAGVKANTSLARYGKTESSSSTAGNYGWWSVTPTDTTSTLYSRWNITAQAGAPADGTGDFRNEIFQYGWVVEIDPFDATSTPRKRTALGRMNHEGCQIGRTIAGVKPAFYMGDDAQNEYIYKFVSATPWSAADASAANRLAIGDKYLDTGTLYVAKFAADGTGQWLPLTYNVGPLTSANAAYPFSSQVDVLINTRLASDALGATRMDRPEWTAVNPATGEMYCTLTNNASRTVATVDAPNPRAYVDAPSTAVGNRNGHIIRIREKDDTSEALTFGWDIYAFGAGSDLDPTNINLSGLDATNDFSSPDGLWFGLPSNASGTIAPVMWIETDDGAYTDVTNCMLLASVPGIVGDGGTRSVTSSAGGVSNTVTTRIGKAPGAALRRFLVGPKECEITGIHTTPDGRSLFVNIQHPGENGGPTNITSSWPANQTGTVTAPSRPRSATIVITKNDGGVVGL